MIRAPSIPVHELTEGDFTRHPVWQFNSDSEAGPGIDESHAEPALNGIHLGTHRSFMVDARYFLESGQALRGAVQVDVLGRRALFTPAILFVGGKSLDPLSTGIGARISRITQQPRSHPVKWVLNATVAGEARPRTGRIWKSKALAAFGLLARLVLLRLLPRGRA